MTPTFKLTNRLAAALDAYEAKVARMQGALARTDASRLGAEVDRIDCAIGAAAEHVCHILAQQTRRARAKNRKP